MFAIVLAGIFAVFFNFDELSVRSIPPKNAIAGVPHTYTIIFDADGIPEQFTIITGMNIVDYTYSGAVLDCALITERRHIECATVDVTDDIEFQLTLVSDVCGFLVNISVDQYPLEEYEIAQCTQSEYSLFLPLIE